MYNSGNSSKNVTGSAIVDGTVEAADLATAVNNDIADGVAGKATADLALPKAGGTMTGAIAGFASTGIDDNATANQATLTDTGLEVVGNLKISRGVVKNKAINLTTTLQDLVQFGSRTSFKISVVVADGSGGVITGYTVAYVSCSGDTATQGTITQEAGSQVTLSWKAASGTSVDSHILQAKVTSSGANQIVVKVEALGAAASAVSGTGWGQSNILL
jgi:hypothetical protein